MFFSVCFVANAIYFLIADNAEYVFRFSSVKDWKIMWYELQLITEKDHLGFEGIYEDWIYSEKRSEVIALFIMQYYCRMGDYKHEGAVKSVRILSVRSNADVLKMVRTQDTKEG